MKITTVANKSKSAEVKTSSCLSFDISHDKGWTKANFFSFDGASAAEILLPFSHQITSPKHFLLTSYMGAAVKIPFYILYRNFKFHP
ncbi:MAG: hypothetical protein ACXWDO_04850 [Bacteroidia bacterium]